jgi:hypothetical protein
VHATMVFAATEPAHTSDGDGAGPA